MFEIGSNVLIIEGPMAGRKGIVKNKHGNKVYVDLGYKNALGLCYFMDTDLELVHEPGNSPIKCMQANTLCSLNMISATLTNKIPKIKKCIFNNPYTIVIWADNSKTKVKAQYGDLYDEEKGLALCIAKRALGNNNKWYDVFKKYLPKHDEE